MDSKTVNDAPDPEGPEVERLLKGYEVAQMLGVSAGTVFHRFERGDLPGFRLWGRKGGPVRFRLSEIESLLDSWRVGGN
jgi:predicted DNA-binding transcriptional regulator AlpA